MHTHVGMSNSGSKMQYPWPSQAPLGPLVLQNCEHICGGLFLLMGQAGCRRQLPSMSGSQSPPVKKLSLSLDTHGTKHKESQSKVLGPSPVAKSPCAVLSWSGFSLLPLFIKTCAERTESNGASPYKKFGELRDDRSRRPVSWLADASLWRSESARVRFRDVCERKRERWGGSN